MLELEIDTAKRLNAMDGGELDKEVSICVYRILTKVTNFRVTLK